MASSRAPSPCSASSRPSRTAGQDSGPAVDVPWSRRKGSKRSGEAYRSGIAARRADQTGDGRTGGERAAADPDLGDGAAQHELHGRVAAQRFGPGPVGEGGFDAQGGQEVGVVQHIGEEGGERGFAEAGLPGAGGGGRVAGQRAQVRVHAGADGQPVAELLDEVRLLPPGDAAGEDVGGPLDALGEVTGRGRCRPRDVLGPGLAEHAAVAEPARRGPAAGRPVVREAGEPRVGEGGGHIGVPAEQPGAEECVVVV